MLYSAIFTSHRIISFCGFLFFEISPLISKMLILYTKIVLLKFLYLKMLFIMDFLLKAFICIKKMHLFLVAHYFCKRITLIDHPIHSNSICIKISYFLYSTHYWNGKSIFDKISNIKPALKITLNNKK